jgi:hypothetical protein
MGNYTEFAGIENVRQGNLHFCGEQTESSCAHTETGDA